MAGEGSRVAELRVKLGKARGRPKGYTQTDFAIEVSRAIGGPTLAPGQISTWEKKPDRYKLAAIAMVHPTDPRGCFRWLTGDAPAMPDIPAVDPSRNDQIAEQRVRGEAGDSQASEAAYEAAKPVKKKRQPRRA